MTRTGKYILILLALCSSYWVLAQDEPSINYSKFPLKIAIGNHAVGFPLQNSFKAFNPHLALGTEFAINKSRKRQLYVSSNLGFIRNKVIGSSINVDLNFGFRYTNKTGLYLETEIGVGTLDQFHPRDIYRLDTAETTYQRVSDPGTFASLVGLKTGIGYDFSTHYKLPFRVGIIHHFFIQTTYFDIASFPIMPQSTTNISLTYKFQKS